MNKQKQTCRHDSDRLVMSMTQRPWTCVTRCARRDNSHQV